MGTGRRAALRSATARAYRIWKTGVEHLVAPIHIFSLFQGYLHYTEDEDLTLPTLLAMCVSVDVRKATLYNELYIH